MSRALLILSTAADRAKACHWVALAPNGTRVEFKAPKRSTEQNDRMWAMLTDVADQKQHMGRKYTPDRWKVIFMAALGHETEFIPSLDGQTFIPWNGRSSDLTVKEMADLITFIQAWGDENGVTFHDPRNSEAA